MSSAFLFVLWAGGGNVPPQLTLARRVAARGHDVRVLAPASIRPAIERAGLLFEPYVDAPEHDEASPETSLIRDFEARTTMGAVGSVRKNLLEGMAGPIAADVLRVMRSHSVDVVAVDHLLLGALFAAEAAGVPSAMLVHTVYPFPADRMPPFGMGWSPLDGPAGAIRDGIGRWLFRRAYEAPLMPRLNEVRHRLGLDPIKSFEDLIARTSGLLVLTSQAFDFPAALPSNVRYVGPQIDELERAPEWEPPWPSDDLRPLVAVGLSTTYQAHAGLLQRTVDALAGLPVKALVSTGGLGLEGVPANVYTAAYVPHARLFPLADIVVTHAGLGTVHAALAHARPLVCLPIGRDQPDNAARLVRRGAAIRLGHQGGAAEIRHAVSTILADPRYEAAAGRLAEAMAFDKAVIAGPDELVGLAGQGGAPSASAWSGERTDQVVVS
jgi:MGT family glycosyltransferase